MCSAQQGQTAMANGVRKAANMTTCFCFKTYHDHFQH